MDISAVGVDLAKHVFQIHAVDAHGHPVLCKRLSRSQMTTFFARQSPCLIGMEACGGAHYWARTLESMGHTVKLMAPRFVKPYVKTNKNDRNDAEAICEAVQRPNMRFVAIKSIEQQSILHLHVSRQLLVKMRTQLSNHLRGLLGEYGLILPQGIAHLADIPVLAEDASNGLPGTLRQLLMEILDHFRQLERKITVIEAQIRQWHRNSEASQRLAEIPGIGLLTATALVGHIGTHAQGFISGRHLAAYLGLVPRQHSSGGKQRLAHISKRGDPYLRTLLIHGARAVIRMCQGIQRCGTTPIDPWLRRLLQRKHPNQAAVAQANRNARIAWALLAHSRSYHSPAGAV
ncbi:IS110 family transposase [Burkholderia sp. Ac-20353]|uniref:IS110 family transposase n=1 Tax=Burkholderia sp. Ac-20353 TaxID=2703894 RepID=UPI00197B23A6|nr:IS110 family transposase [Burkholderia sp. Ac-20353]MBN3790167.1 IS110 family transposase [Burkholderia sp. Ac-20353]